MRLQDLLNDDDDSVWRQQRRGLLRFFGVTVALAAVLIAAMVWTWRRTPNGTPENGAAPRTLSELMRLKKEAETLREEIDLTRRASPGVAVPNQRARRRPSSEATAASVGAAQRFFDYDPGEGFLKVVPEEEQKYLPTGSVFMAQLITPIKTSVERTFVMAETTREFRMDMVRRIPKGSRLIGRSWLNPILKGVIVEFDTLVLPNGIETSISGLALSRNALPEIDGLYFSNELETYGAALAFGFLSGFAAGARETEPTIFGAQPEVNLRNQVLSGLSTASFQVAEDILRDVQRRAVEYVVVPAGEKIFVALTRRYDVQPQNRE